MADSRLSSGRGWPLRIKWRAGGSWNPDFDHERIVIGTNVHASSTTDDLKIRGDKAMVERNEHRRQYDRPGKGTNKSTGNRQKSPRAQFKFKKLVWPAALWQALPHFNFCPSHPTRRGGRRRERR